MADPDSGRRTGIDLGWRTFSWCSSTSRSTRRRPGAGFGAPAGHGKRRRAGRIGHRGRDLRRTLGVKFGHPCPDAVGVDRVVPRRVQRVREVHPPTVAADFHDCGPPASGRSGAAGCGSRRTIPPRRTDAVSRGWNGSLTSYCLSSPVPQHDTYSQRSSTDRSMSVTSGGAAPKGLNSGGRSSASAGSAGS